MAEEEKVGISPYALHSSESCALTTMTALADCLGGTGLLLANFLTPYLPTD